MTKPAKKQPVNEETEKAKKKLEAMKLAARTDGEDVVLNIFPMEVKKLDDLLMSGRYDYSQIPKIACDVNIPRTAVPVANGSSSEARGGDQPPVKRAKPDYDRDSSSATQTQSHHTSSSVDTTESVQVQGTKVLTFTCGTVPSNSGLTQLIDEIKPMLRDAVEYFNRVKVWIVLLIPKMEDGNNFGVSIQEEVLGEVRSVESDSAAYCDQLSRYFLSRGRMITKIARYPHVDDYRRAIVDIDERQFINMRLVLIEMRNHYTTMHDLITKNLEKIRTPRNSNMEHMY